MGADGGAALNVFFRARIVILALLVLALIGTAALWLRSRPDMPVDWPVAAAILAAFSFLCLRHAGLAALTLIAPLPAFLAVVMFLPVGGDRLSLWLAFLPGFVVASFFAASIARQAAEGAPGKMAASQTLQDLTPATLCALIAACVPAFLFANGAMLAAVLAGAGLCALIATPLAASWLPFGENFAARANRLREWRERGLAYLIPVALPRWGWSLSGVAIVLAVLGVFGALPLGLPSGANLIGYGAIAVAVAALFLATRDWRRSLAALLAFLPALFFTLWVFARMPHDPAALRHLLQALGIGFMPVVLAAARAARFMRDGEDVAVASIRTLERDGATILFTVAATALSLAAFHRLQDVPAAIAILLGAPGALVFAPAFAALLESLFPRRATIEARYRVG
jgi:hypothetical protein